MMTRTLRHYLRQAGPDTGNGPQLLHPHVACGQAFQTLLDAFQGRGKPFERIEFFPQFATPQVFASACSHGHAFERRSAKPRRVHALPARGITMPSTSRIERIRFFTAVRRVTIR